MWGRRLRFFRRRRRRVSLWCFGRLSLSGGCRGSRLFPLTGSLTTVVILGVVVVVRIAVSVAVSPGQ